MRSLENHSFEIQLFHINGWSKQEKLFLESRYENNTKVQTIKSLTNRKMHCNIRVLTWPLTMCRYHYHGRQKICSFHYTCFDFRLRNNEISINKTGAIK